MVEHNQVITHCEFGFNATVWDWLSNGLGFGFTTINLLINYS